MGSALVHSERRRGALSDRPAGAGPAVARWSAELAGWAIPAELLARAPEPPWGFPVELFRAAATPADSPSRAAAWEALPPGGVVLDVGCGGGAAGLALLPRAGELVGVDSSPPLLAEFAAAAGRAGVAHREVAGSWPAVARRAGRADVVVCHHVLYNVADLAPFVRALSAAARRRVVVELTDRHPLVPTVPLWRHFHGLARPDGPDAALAQAALAELGLRPEVRRWSRPAHRTEDPQAFAAVVRMNRRRLCLPAEAEPEVARLQAAIPPQDGRVTLWWDTDATGA